MKRVTYYVPPVSEMYGIDMNGDGVFDALVTPKESSGMQVGVYEDDRERRCAVVFDLQSFEGMHPLMMVSVQLTLWAFAGRGGGHYELHGFVGGPTATLDNLAVSNRLAAVAPSTDVTTFVASQVGAGARYIGFSIWNVADVGFQSYSLASRDRGTKLVITLEVPWALALHDVPRLVVEMRPPDPWALPFPEGSRGGERAGTGPSMQRMLTLHAVSEMYGVERQEPDSPNYYELFPPGGESSPGIKVGADPPGAETGRMRRCAVVFDLGGLSANAQFPIASAQLSLQSAGGVEGGGYELHGFASGSTLAASDLTISNRLFGPVWDGLPFPIDVTTFVKSQLAAGVRHVTFSVWNVGNRGRVSYLTLSEVPWMDGSRLVLTYDIPWILPRPDVPGLVVEIKPPDPWELPRSDVPGLVAELQARLQREEDASQTSSPMAQLLQSVLIRELAASLAEPGARSIQQAALEMIGPIAADEIARLSREESRP
ncbi:MAG TPA: hypothetical protein VJU81_08415 [Methylomirabilota bacterium]|nr:hypothetical protein [Methylomirabilota bacterium]